MSSSLVLDSGVLGLLCHPRKEVSDAPTRSLIAYLSTEPGCRIYVPEIADYELRRKLLHLLATQRVSTRALERLDQLRVTFLYLELTTVNMRLAAELWADARTRGVPTAAEESLDADVILAAQAIGAVGTVVTTNPRHLERYVAATNWDSLANS